MGEICVGCDERRY
jgi:hypothetical protein